MNITEFNDLIDNRCVEIKKVLASKGEEYSMSGDRLHNFNVAARLKNTTREDALWGMLIKHEVSVLDMIHNLQFANRELPTEAYINEKIGDFINYLILLEACFKDRIRRQKEDVR